MGSLHFGYNTDKISSSGNGSKLYSGGDKFEFRPGYQLPLLNMFVVSSISQRKFEVSTSN
jgi:hypothetical protein